MLNIIIQTISFHQWFIFNINVIINKKRVVKKFSYNILTRSNITESVLKDYNVHVLNNYELERILSLKVNSQFSLCRSLLDTITWPSWYHHLLAYRKHFQFISTNLTMDRYRIISGLMVNETEFWWWKIKIPAPLVILFSYPFHVKKIDFFLKSHFVFFILTLFFKFFHTACNT